ncbi:MAG: biotin carboxyl carrier protein [Saprospiraceae bacterium]
MKYKALVNNHFQIELSGTSIQDLDIVQEDSQTYHVIYKGKSYNTTLAAIDFVAKTFKIKINGRSYDLKLDDKFDQLVHKLGLETISGNKLKDVKAPMPGLVLNIAVNAGQEIKKGDTLLILEAMKMENIIKSDGEGIIKTIHIHQGIAVDKGQLLIEME